MATFIITYGAPHFMSPAVLFSETFGVAEDWQQMPWGQNLPRTASVWLIW